MSVGPQGHFSSQPSIASSIFLSLSTRSPEEEPDHEGEGKTPGYTLPPIN